MRSIYTDAACVDAEIHCEQALSSCLQTRIRLLSWQHLEHASLLFASLRCNVRRRAVARLVLATCPGAVAHALPS
jgi:hypothetical protein